MRLASVRQHQDRAIQRFTLLAGSTTSTAFGSRLTTPNRGPRSAPIPIIVLMKSRLFQAIPTSYGQVYVGFAGSGYAYLSSNGPSVAAIAISPPSGLEETGAVITLTLAMSEVVTVAGGTPTLTLNDGGTATYTGGSGTDSLTFSYTVAAGQNTSALTATAANLNGATITDSGGNAANLSLSGLPQVGPQIESAPAAVTAVVDSSPAFSRLAARPH